MIVPVKVFRNEEISLCFDDATFVISPSGSPVEET